MPPRVPILACPAVPCELAFPASRLLFIRQRDNQHVCQRRRHSAPACRSSGCPRLPFPGFREGRPVHAGQLGKIGQAQPLPPASSLQLPEQLVELLNRRRAHGDAAQSDRAIRRPPAGESCGRLPLPSDVNFCYAKNASHCHRFRLSLTNTPCYSRSCSRDSSCRSGR